MFASSRIAAPSAVIAGPRDSPSVLGEGGRSSAYFAARARSAGDGSRIT
jgi:hypothetical protein